MNLVKASLLLLLTGVLFWSNGQADEKKTGVEKQPAAVEKPSLEVLLMNAQAKAYTDLLEPGTGADVVDSAAITSLFTIPAAALVDCQTAVNGTINRGAFNPGGGYIHVIGGGAYFRAPVSVATGKVIRQIRMYGIDNDASVGNPLSCVLFRVKKTTGVVNIIGVLSSAGSAGGIRNWSLDVNSGPIDNAIYTYHVYVYIPFAGMSLYAVDLGIE